MVEISSYFSCIYSGGGVVAKSCLTLAIPWTVATRLLCPWDFPGKNTGVDCYFLLQGVFPTQGSNPCLFHCRRIIYHWATREALMHLYTIQNYMQHRCIVHIYKLFDKFYVTFIISFDILSNPGFLSQHCWHLGLDNSLLWEADVYHRIFSSILDPSTLEASCTSHNCNNQKCLQTLPNVFWEEISPVKNHWAHQ